MIELKKTEAINEESKGSYKVLLKNVFYNKYLTLYPNDQKAALNSKDPFIVALADEADENAEFDIEFLDRWQEEEAKIDKKPILIRLLKKFEEKPNDIFVLCLESDSS